VVFELVGDVSSKQTILRHPINGFAKRGPFSL